MAQKSYQDIRRVNTEVHLLGASGGQRKGSKGWGHWAHNAWAIDCIYHGQLLQRIRNGQPFVRPSGMVMLYAPGVPYSQCGRYGSYSCGYCLFHLSGRTDRDFSRLLGRAGYWIIHDETGLIGERLRQLYQAMIYRHEGFDLIAYGNLLDILGLLKGSEPVRHQVRVLRTTESPTRERSLVGRFEAYVKAHITEPIRVADLAGHLGISVSKLAHTYPRLGYETPHRAILRLKIEVVKRLMLREGLSVKECAGRIGFSSPFQLSRAFKRIEGLSPRRYQQSLAKETQL